MKELLATFTAVGGPEEWAIRIGTGHKTSTQPNAPVKAVAMEAAARGLADVGITTTSDLRQAAENPDRLATIEKIWMRVVGQRSGITWRYALMLAGVDGVKPDRMSQRFIAGSLGIERTKMTPSFAEVAVKETSIALGVTATELDHAIWQWQRVPRRKTVS